MRPFYAVRRFFHNAERSAQALGEIGDGLRILNLSLQSLEQRYARGTNFEGGPAHLRRVLASSGENRPENFQYVFDKLLALAPSVYDVPRQGYFVDVMGILTDARTRDHDPSTLPAGPRRVPVPTLQADGNENSEGWFEVVDWFVAAQEARNQFVMISLGACYGGQLVGAYKALELINPLPAKLVAVEADPEGYGLISGHFRDNGINPDDHWIVQAAVSDTNAPVLFPVGAVKSGGGNCVSTNEPKARENWIELLRRDGNPAATLENLIRSGSTGLIHDIGYGFSGEVKFVSAITIADLLANFDCVDLLEVDIQQSEIVAIPPFLDHLRRKVKRLHIGTHGDDVHQSLYQLFAKAGWDIVFNYKPTSIHDTALGRFRTNDGILTVRNPDL